MGQKEAQAPSTHESRRAWCALMNGRACTRGGNGYAAGALCQQRYRNAAGPLLPTAGRQAALAGNARAGAAIPVAAGLAPRTIQAIAARSSRQRHWLETGSV